MHKFDNSNSELNNQIKNVDNKYILFIKELENKLDRYLVQNEICVNDKIVNVENQIKI